MDQVAAILDLRAANTGPINFCGNSLYNLKSMRTTEWKWIGFITFIPEVKFYVLCIVLEYSIVKEQDYCPNHQK